MKAKTTNPTILLRDRCLSHFTMLRIPVQPTALDELLTRAEKENLSYLSFLDHLLGVEAGARRERAVARRLREARFPENKTLSSIVSLTRPHATSSAAGPISAWWAGVGSGKAT